MLTLPEREREREVATLREIELTGERHVPVARHVELPVHPEVVRQVRPAIARADVATGEAGKRNRCRHHQPDTVLLRGEHLPAGRFDDVGVIAPAGAPHPRRAERVQPQA